MAMEIEWNDQAWDDIARLAIEKVAVPRCQAIADACNRDLESRGHPSHKEGDPPGYIVGVEGGKPLTRHDYRSTVITKTNDAMLDNAQNNTLLRNLNAGEGD